jgi:hypothetical protein
MEKPRTKKMMVAENAPGISQVMMQAMGGLLVLTGIAFLTGAISEVSYWLFDTFPVLGKIG